MNNKELQERLIDFSVNIINLTKFNQENFEGSHLSKQIIRSSTSCPLNYGEARGAESIRDFIHKIQIVLKELRETHVNLQIIRKAGINKASEKLEESIQECNELISIFVKSVITAKKK